MKDQQDEQLSRYWIRVNLKTYKSKIIYVKLIKPMNRFAGGRPILHRKFRLLRGRISKVMSERKTSGFIIRLFWALLFFPMWLPAADITSQKGERWEPITALRPTQFCAGFRSVDEKARELDQKTPEKLRSYLIRHPVPVILGPQGQSLYLIDRHHLTLAYLKLNITKVPIAIYEDKSHLSATEFRNWMIQNSFVYLFDENDQAKPFEALPTSLSDLADDPYRSLAGMVEDRGGYKKTKELFRQFKWARFFRRFIKEEEIRQNFDKALETALALAQSPEARDLPGYSEKRDHKD